MHLHPVFNISRLKQFKDGLTSHPDRVAPLGRPLPEIRHEDGAEIFEVERILAVRGAGAHKRYLVEWVGYPSWEATWEPLANIGGASDAMAEFIASQ